MLIVTGIDGDEADCMVVVTTPGSNVGSGVRVFVGVGNRYLAFASIPFDYSNGIVADFTAAPTCSANVSQNTADIMNMLASPPLDKISLPA